MTIALFTFLFMIGACSMIWYRLAHRRKVSGDLCFSGSPLYVFDFDGTICPSYPLLIEELNNLADEWGYRKIGPDEAIELQNGSARAFLKTLGISTLKIPFIMRDMRKAAGFKLLSLDPILGVKKAIEALKARGCSLGILTSNSELNVRLYLEKHEINSFDFIYSANNIFGKAKHLKKIVKKTGQIPTFIGDEVRDIEAAKKAGVPSIAVTWGYNSSALLHASAPDFLYENPDDFNNSVAF